MPESSGLTGTKGVFHVEQGIKVKTTKRDELYTSFVITGHANSGPHGKDIVCAAVSVVTQMVLHALRRVTPCTYGTDSGLVYCNLPFASLNREQVLVSQAFISEMLHTLRNINDSHPGYITFEEESINT